jgi:hypothetical protein
MTGTLKQDINQSYHKENNQLDATIDNLLTFQS